MTAPRAIGAAMDIETYKTELKLGAAKRSAVGRAADLDNAALAASGDAPVLGQP